MKSPKRPKALLLVFTALAMLFCFGGVVIAEGEAAKAEPTAEAAVECVAPLVANVAAEGEELPEDAPACVCADGSTPETAEDGTITCPEPEGDPDTQDSPQAPATDESNTTGDADGSEDGDAGGDGDGGDTAGD